MVLDLFKKFTTLWIILIVLAFFPIFTSTFDLPFWNDVVMRIMLLGMAAMGLNIVFGFGGMVSFGHAAFMGVGAYCAGISQYYGLDNGWYQLLMSAVSCGILGILIGFLALRTSGIYFIMITLAFAQMLYFFFVSLEEFGGDDGLIMDRSDFIFFDLYEPLRLYYLIFFILATVSIMLMLLIRSRFGVILQAIKSNESRLLYSLFLCPVFLLCILLVADRSAHARLLFVVSHFVIRQDCTCSKISLKIRSVIS